MENEYLIYILIGLLFAKDPLYAWLEKRFNFKLNTKQGAEDRALIVKEETNTFHNALSRELGMINEKLTAIPKIEQEVTRLADHVAVQNGRISKLEERRWRKGDE